MAPPNETGVLEIPVPPHRVAAAARRSTRRGLTPFAASLAAYYLFLAVFHALLGAPTHRLMMASGTAISGVFFLAFAFAHRHKLVHRTRVWGWVITFASVVIANISLYQVVSNDPRNVLNFAMVNVVAGVVVLSRPILAGVLAVGFAAWAGIGATSQTGTPLFDLVYIVGTWLLALGLNHVRLGDLEQNEGLRLRAEMELDRAERRLEQRNRAKEATERSREGLYQIMSSIQDAVIIVQNMMVVSANRAMMERLGLDRETILRTPLTDLVRQDDRALAQPSLLIREGNAGVDLCFLDHRGETVEFDVRCSRVDFNNAPAYLLLCREVKQPVEDRHLLADRMLAVGTLAAGVAHEINNPLAYVVANLEMMQMELANPANERELRLRQLTDVALEGSIRVKDIVVDLKNFSRQEDDQAEPVDVHDAIETAVRMSWNEIRHRANLVREFKRTPAVVISRAKLGQVILNLLVNAAQAIEEGDVNQQQIRIKTHVQHKRVIIEISDTGSGMSSALRARIFDPFFTTKPVGVGTGLGLPFCREVIEQAGGTLTVDSEPHQGSTFRIELPGTDRTATPSLPPMAAHPTAQQLQQTTRRVLVIDDEAALTEAISAVLSRDHVVVADSGPSGHAFLEDQEFDCVLCDIMMPEMSGPDVYLAVKDRWPEVVHRMAFITGGTFTEHTRSFLEQTTVPVLHKPFRAKALRELVDQLTR